MSRTKAFNLDLHLVLELELLFFQFYLFPLFFGGKVRALIELIQAPFKALMFLVEPFKFDVFLDQGILDLGATHCHQTILLTVSV